MTQLQSLQNIDFSFSTVQKKEQQSLLSLFITIFFSITFLLLFFFSHQSIDFLHDDINNNNQSVTNKLSPNNATSYYIDTLDAQYRGTFYYVQS